MKTTKNTIFNEPYPLNLLKMIAYNRGLEAPEELTYDVMDGVEYALLKLSDWEKSFLLQRYKERKEYEEIAAFFSKTKESVIKKKKLFLKNCESHIFGIICVMGF